MRDRMGPALNVGETAWQWLHDERDWEHYSLLFVSLKRDEAGYEVGLWQVWDEGDPERSPTDYQPTDPGRAHLRAANDELRFATLEEAITELQKYDVAPDRFGSKEDLQRHYRAALTTRTDTDWERTPPRVYNDDEG